ncbi:LytTR family transcriptional regulator DNA-binding domain-containing protein [Neolewinella lacunae]|uniref:Response regulator transcription factor n=1 Tax=Neolewinella lacunae TaxID=1517758 RepID=A0A923PEH9_9BACT|nr:LytTR family DNA-binding domain-containing protein [Neolewinella lacunae]MBC6992582.1 response regulator transcription factor [Neolewinella lacunae]MDN3634323.1 LytTR family transcriptional regulator DNA-binding domain-containing protein [Neolewinella lacunae]
MVPSIYQTEILVCEPNLSFRDLLLVLLTKMGVRKVVAASNVAEAESNFRQHPPHVCILDADVAESFEFATKIRQNGLLTPLIFLGSSVNREAKRKKVSAIKNTNFLDDDLSSSRLTDALNYALLQLENSLLNQKIAIDHSSARVGPIAAQGLQGEQHVFFKIGDAFRAMNIEKISFFFADNKLTYARVEKRNYPTNVQLKTLEEKLFPQFLRCHKKYLINVMHIESISTKDDKIKINEEQLPIGYSYRKPFLDQLNLLR